MARHVIKLGSGITASDDGSLRAEVLEAICEEVAVRRRAGDDVVWDQCHILQSGTYTGTYVVDGTSHEVDGWVGQRG